MLAVVIGWNLWVYQHMLSVTDENELYYVSYLGYRAKTVPLATCQGLLPRMRKPSFFR